MLVASNFSSTQEQLVFKLKLIILVKDLCIFLRRGGGGRKGSGWKVILDVIIISINIVITILSFSCWKSVN